MTNDVGIRTYQQWIGGDWVDSASGRTAEVETRPTGRSSPTSRRPGRRTSTEPRSAAATAFESWQHSTPQDRSLMLLKLADAIEARADELGRP